MMAYLNTMLMLLKNSRDDYLTQERIDFARIEWAHVPEAQLQLDRKQTALDEARERNDQRIFEIAMLN